MHLLYVENGAALPYSSGSIKKIGLPGLEKSAKQFYYALAFGNVLCFAI
jgi:hypothetical protein